MKLYSAVIYLALLTTRCSRCDDERYGWDSQGYQPSRGRRQTGYRQTAEGPPSSLHKTDESIVQARITPQSRSRSGYNFVRQLQGSHIDVKNSHVSQLHTDVRSDSRDGEMRRCCCMCHPRGRVTYPAYPLVSSNAGPSNLPVDGVMRKESPQTERTKIRAPTVKPDAGVGSNSNPVAGEKQKNVGQATEQDKTSFLPSSPLCGVSIDDRIVGGMQAVVGKWPWLVAYGYRDKRTEGKNLRWLCGGSLVTEKHTLTVAHCALISTHFIDVARIGDIYLNSTVNEKSIAEERSVSKNIIIHPNYSKEDKKHDIAIVTLNKPFNSRYKPICLPFRRDMRNKKFVSKKSNIAGWGATDDGGMNSNVLLDAELPIVDNEVCRNVYAPLNVAIEDQHICAGGEAGRDACRGDSGGPLMLKNENETSYYLIGLVAFGSTCGAPGVPGVYTRITSHMDWLVANLKN